MIRKKLTEGQFRAILGSACAIVLIVVMVNVIFPGDAKSESFGKETLGAAEEQTQGPEPTDRETGESDPIAEPAPTGEATDEITWTIGDVFAIQVDHRDILYLATEAEADAVLAGLLARYVTHGAEIIEHAFAERVEVVKKHMTEPTVIFPILEGIAYIATGSTQPKTYAIQSGDSLWDVAIAHGISPYALQEMNPGLNPTRLSIGQEIVLYETQPFLNVQTKEVVTATERIAFHTHYEDTDSLYRGQTQITSAGSHGSKEVVTEIIKENGKVIAANVLSEVILHEPVAQFALRGVMALPVYTGSGSGSLTRPLEHLEVSSAFGSSGRRGHTGVDLRAPKGTPIMAAAGGVVIAASYAGSYGNLIKISHGAGLETWYSHCDTMSVSIGEEVAQGQIIATVGNTGNARGYHLHFEVRRNGAAVNPMHYL